VRRSECSYQHIINISHENGLFDWLLDGKEVEVARRGFTRHDFILKSDSHSKFGKLLRRYWPGSGAAKGPKFRLFRIGKGEATQVVRTSCLGCW